MPTVTIKAIGHQYILHVNKYMWLLEHRDTPLPIRSIWWRNDGTIDNLCVVYDGEDGIITLFPDGNRLEYEVNYNAGAQIS